MKVLKFLGWILIGSVGLFFLSGAIIPEVKYKVTTEINQPVDSVFALLTDRKKQPIWSSYIDKLAARKEKPGLVGSQYQYTVNGALGVADMLETIIALKKNKNLTIEVKEIDRIKKDEYHFLATGAKTLVQLGSSSRGVNYFNRCLFATFYWYLKGIDQKNLEEIKNYLEK